jgi:N-carbamoylputrescine amidase
MAAEPRDAFTLGLVQTHASDDPADNLARNVALVERAAAQGAEVVCLQELFRSRYFCQTEDHAHFALAEPIPGPTTEVLGPLARRLGVVLVASLFEKRARGLFHNTAAVLDADGTLCGTYRKMHIPDDPRFYEKFYFAPGDLGFRVFDTRAGRLGVLVCWDQWYPEAARLTALAGAEVLLYPTAIGTWRGEQELRPTQHDAWRTIQRSHAIANGVYVAAVNRVGREDELDFWGGSFVAGPDGRVLAEAGRDEEILVVACPRGRIDAAREGWPFLRDRRVDAYGDLGKRWLD